jgi:cell division protein ZapA
MSQVSVTINGRQYRMACEDGQEDHLMSLARELDQRIGKLRAQFGQIGDSRLIVMAALMMADEVVEMGERMRRLEQELAALQDARVAAADTTKMTQAAIVQAFNSAAERIEGIARKLNQSVGGSNSNVAMG